MVLPNETFVDILSHLDWRSLVLLQLSNRTFDGVIRANKEHLARARRYRLDCEYGRVRLHQLRDGSGIETTGGPIYESDGRVSIAESLRRIKALLDATEAENDAHPITFASFSYGAWVSPSDSLVSCLPSLEHIADLQLSGQEEFLYTDWSRVERFIEPLTGLRLLLLQVFDATDVDWKFLRGEAILTLHRVAFDEFSNPEYSINDHDAENEIFRYCFDNSKFPHFDKPLASYFNAWEFSPEFVGRVIKKADAVPFKVLITLTASAELRLDKERFVKSSSSYRCYYCDKYGVGQMCSGPHLKHRYTSRRSSLVVIVDGKDITVRNYPHESDAMK